MRVAWVHPSWRDLVIDELARAPERRRAFLDACGLPGVELALSTAGGPSGARRLPLVIADEDWDALGDAIHRLALTLAHADLRRLLAALDTAIDGADRRERAELAAIAEMALATVQRRLDREAVLLDPGLVERWHALAGWLDKPPDPPAVGPTLAALDPVGADPGDPASLRRLDDFLAIIEATGRPLPEGTRAELAAFLRAAEGYGELPAATYPALRRLARVYGELASRIFRLLDEEAAVRAHRAMAEQLSPPEPDANDRRVRRILADL